jgi:hypothetical protein
VEKLRGYLLERGLLPDYTNEWVRRLLRREGISLQRTNTWKESPDPDFEVEEPQSETLRPSSQKEPCRML